MLSVQKPTSHFSHSPHLAMHRRVPSAPVLIRTTPKAGMFEIQSPKHVQARPRAFKTPTAPRRSIPAPQPTTPPQAHLKPSPEIADKKHSPEKRGRQAAKPRESRPASSHSSVRGRRNNTRQPSPELTQADVFSSPIAAPTAGDSIPRTGAPKLTAQPSGKLARRRQPHQTPTKPIAIPERVQPSPPQMSRSVPPPAKHSIFNFPICDDSAEDLTTFPTTPTRKRYDDGPKTAPLVGTLSGFPFNVPATLPRAIKRRNHQRSPSESFSDESSSDEQSVGSRPRSAASAEAFASSTFQNSPSPEDLPMPAFM
ncbi:hypothetical protein CYLTODRAFT_89014 [Cylindrobasidium torrendii FP15055 ss-10]|uniref:Uncharacterized protein n=1 Tax=Cylindrobasidium torrendii FP15055 ss-10 TaxID=1314674 RepID=A0A0D7B546_9AGAR|nr:hypothetical protein CYLTODRAFT_89014 [Cylindrobasidium torrendii FP15055 ss-10]